MQDDGTIKENDAVKFGKHVQFRGVVRKVEGSTATVVINSIDGEDMVGDMPPTTKIRVQDLVKVERR